MIHGRIVSRSLSQSRKYAALQREARALGDFAQALYMLLVIHADDCGRLDGDTETIKWLVLPTSPHPVADFDQALAAMVRVDLVQLYTVAGHNYYQINDFARHQALRFPATSRFPAPTEGRSKEVRKQGSKEARKEEEQQEGSKEGRRPSVDESLSDCPHTPRCSSVSICRRIESVLQAVARGRLSAGDGARLRAMWQDAPTMLTATLPTRRARIRR